MLKKIITALVIMTTTAMADYNLIVPQKPSGGTSVWAQIVVAEMVANQFCEYFNNNNIVNSIT